MRSPLIESIKLLLSVINSFLILLNESHLELKDPERSKSRVVIRTTPTTLSRHGCLQVASELLTTACISYGRRSDTRDTQTRGKGDVRSSKERTCASFSKETRRRQTAREFDLFFQLDRRLNNMVLTQAQLEVQIFNFEGSYLTETAQHSGGNIIQGFDGYLKNQNVGRRRHEPTDADRVFSNSSLTYQKVRVRTSSCPYTSLISTAEPRTPR